VFINVLNHYDIANKEQHLFWNFIIFWLLHVANLFTFVVQWIHDFKNWYFSCHIYIHVTYAHYDLYASVKWRYLGCRLDLMKSVLKRHNRLSHLIL